VPTHSLLKGAEEEELRDPDEIRKEEAQRELERDLDDPPIVEPESVRLAREARHKQENAQRDPNEAMERNSGQPATRLLGNNPRGGQSSRERTDLPGGPEAAFRLFNELTDGQTIERAFSADGSSRLTSPNGVQMRIKYDGTTVIDYTHPAGTRESIHFGR
jgi:hypothetical protein